MLLYLSNPGDFVLLHLVTSLHAVEQIARHLPRDEQRLAAGHFTETPVIAPDLVQSTGN